MNHYVYIWYNIETSYVFYIGKGSLNRASSMQNRNKYFINYKNKYNCDYKIIIGDITSEEAFAIERYLVFECRKLNLCKTNIADGGFGGNGLKGKNNPMYGRTWWTDETPIEKINEWKNKVRHCGENNAQFGISPKDRMSEDTYNNWMNKHNGDSTRGIKNGRCVPISLYDMDMNLIKNFDYIKSCVEYMIENYMPYKTVESLRSTIRNHKNLGSSYKGFYFK